MFTQESFLEVDWALIITHVPVMFIEGVVAIFCVGFLNERCE
jgi:cobalt/nickel transport system permease protein